MKISIMRKSHGNSWMVHRVYESLEEVPEPERIKIHMMLAVDKRVTDSGYNKTVVTQWWLEEIGLVQHVSGGTDHDNYCVYFGLKGYKGGDM